MALEEAELAADEEDCAMDDMAKELLDAGDEDHEDDNDGEAMLLLLPGL